MMINVGYLGLTYDTMLVVLTRVVLDIINGIHLYSKLVVTSKKFIWHYETGVEKLLGIGERVL